MAIATKRLSARKVKTLSTPGKHSDGDGLSLIVEKSGSKRWAFIYRWNGKNKEMGLGGLSKVTLADARIKAAEARALLGEDKNPILERKEAQRLAKIKGADAITFGAFAEEMIPEFCKGFRNAKHKQQWANTIRDYCGAIHGKPITDITTDDMLGILRPIWMTKAETANRVRGRVERLLNAAKAKGLREGENPAAWRGHLELLLPAKQKLQRGHHAAMPFDILPDFIATLQTREGMGARALEFCILTAARTGEVLGATWGEIDFETKVWTLAPERMKAGRGHRVPLSTAAIDLLQTLYESRESAYVFPGFREGKPLSNMAMEMVLRRMKIENVTVHGFRSTFRDWAGECTSYARDTAEAALAHVVGDATERAYRRGDALEKRRRLMQDWAAFTHLKQESGLLYAFPKAS